MKEKKSKIRIFGSGRWEVVKALGRKGSAKRGRNYRGKNFLRIAVSKDEIEEVEKILINNGCYKIFPKAQKTFSDF